MRVGQIFEGVLIGLKDVCIVLLWGVDGKIFRVWWGYDIEVLVLVFDGFYVIVECNYVIYCYFWFLNIGQEWMIGQVGLFEVLKFLLCNMGIEVIVVGLFGGLLLGKLVVISEMLQSVVYDYMVFLLGLGGVEWFFICW